MMHVRSCFFHIDFGNAPRRESLKTEVSIYRAQISAFREESSGSRSRRLFSFKGVSEFPAAFQILRICDTDLR
jgi:hypothetical protein